jgi:hypothetical protein
MSLKNKNLNGTWGFSFTCQLSITIDGINQLIFVGQFPWQQIIIE